MSSSEKYSGSSDDEASPPESDTSAPAPPPLVFSPNRLHGGVKDQYGFPSWSTDPDSCCVRRCAAQSDSQRIPAIIAVMMMISAALQGASIGSAWATNPTHTLYIFQICDEEAVSCRALSAVDGAPFANGAASFVLLGSSTCVAAISAILALVINWECELTNCHPSVKPSALIALTALCTVLSVCGWSFYAAAVFGPDYTAELGFFYAVAATFPLLFSGVASLYWARVRSWYSESRISERTRNLWAEVAVEGDVRADDGYVSPFAPRAPDRSHGNMYTTVTETKAEDKERTADSSTEDKSASFEPVYISADIDKSKPLDPPNPVGGGRMKAQKGDGRCTHCGGFFKERHLYEHYLMCPLNPDRKEFKAASKSKSKSKSKRSKGKGKDKPKGKTNGDQVHNGKCPYCEEFFKKDHLYDHYLLCDKKKEAETKRAERQHRDASSSDKTGSSYRSGSKRGTDNGSYENTS